jgi:hypothetical protein
LFPEIHGGRDIRTDCYGASTGTSEDFTKIARARMVERVRAIHNTIDTKYDGRSED